MFQARQRITEPPGQNQRLRCPRCLQAEFSCYCDRVRPFDPGVSFVILMHPLELRRRIASGRMAHLFLKNSALWVGTDYLNDPRLLEAVSSSDTRNLVLFPSPDAIDVSQEATWESLPLKTRPWRIFVIDGTWTTAKKTLRKNLHLSQMQKICFVPKVASRFRVRKQPHPHCLSTLEAIHQLLDGMPQQGDLALGTRPHDRMLETFDSLVTQQIHLMEAYREHNDGALNRRLKKL